jgi:hypothetical protein
LPVDVVDDLLADVKAETERGDFFLGLLEVDPEAADGESGDVGEDEDPAEDCEP